MGNRYDGEEDVMGVGWRMYVRDDDGCWRCKWRSRPRPKKKTCAPGDEQAEPGGPGHPQPLGPPLPEDAL
eukprot:2151204-Pyramimonas_sp.AAC.1